MTAILYDVHKKSGDLDGVASGTTVAGETVVANVSNRRKVEGLSAILVVEAETEDLTITGKWQVSHDKSTWLDVANGPQNAAGVAVATGTSGDDAEVKRVYPAPEAVNGWMYARFAIVTGGTTGTSSDKYSISYAYRAL